MGQRSTGLRSEGRFSLLPPSSKKTINRVAVFVDAAYLIDQGIPLITDRKPERRDVLVTARRTRKFFKKFTKSHCGAPLLRIYWYEELRPEMRKRLDPMARGHDLKLRQGIVNPAGVPCGVQALILNDMITLARNRAISDAVLLARDEVLRVGVQQAQEQGIRVHLVGIEPASESQSSLLRREVDTVHELTTDDIEELLSFGERVPEVPDGWDGTDEKAPLAPAAGTGGEETDNLSPADQSEQRMKMPDLPEAHNNALFAAVSELLGRQLERRERRRLLADIEDFLSM